MGARASDVLWLVLGQGLKPALAGAAIGLVVAISLSRVMTKLLFGVEPTDPVTMIAVAILLACVATLACWLPARRATRIEPTAGLRIE